MFFLLRKMGKPTSISLVHVQPQLVATVVQQGSYTQVPYLLRYLYQTLHQKDVCISGSPLYICHEMTGDAVQEALRDQSAYLEVAIPIASPFVSDNSDIHCRMLDGGTMAKAIHMGPYESCSVTYSSLYQRIIAHGKKVTGYVREMYQNDPDRVLPEDVQTTIYVPVG